MAVPAGRPRFAPWPRRRVIWLAARS